MVSAWRSKGSSNRFGIGLVHTRKENVYTSLTTRGLASPPRNTCLYLGKNTPEKRWKWSNGIGSTLLDRWLYKPLYVRGNPVTCGLIYLMNSTEYYQMLSFEGWQQDAHSELISERTQRFMGNVWWQKIWFLSQQSIRKVTKFMRNGFRELLVLRSKRNQQGWFSVWSATFNG